jgi:hypothetical protein
MIYTQKPILNNRTYRRQFINEKDITIINGTAMYDDNTPMKNAVILVEILSDCTNQYEVIGYTLTDNNGNFLVEIICRNNIHRLTIKESSLENSIMYF